MTCLSGAAAFVCVALPRGSRAERRTCADCASTDRIPRPPPQALEKGKEAAAFVADKANDAVAAIKK